MLGRVDIQYLPALLDRKSRDSNLKRTSVSLSPYISPRWAGSPKPVPDLSMLTCAVLSAAEAHHL